jgi:uncharacterized LabA/DUF88 family protein
MRTAEIVQPDIIVLASGDKDFIPVILELRRRGIRVEVAAFAGINAAREVMLKASGFINICRYLAEQNNTDQESLEPDEEVADDYSASEPQAETEDDQPMIRNYSIPSSAEYAQ